MSAANNILRTCEPQPPPTGGRRGRRNFPKHRRGFSLGELLVVMTLLGLLAVIAIPLYQKNLYRSRAARVIGDLQAVRTAAHMYYAEARSWPADGGPGVLPEELAPFVSGLEFSGDGYDLDWEVWDTETGPLAGVTVVTSDPVLDATLSSVVTTGGSYVRMDGRYTLVVEAPPGVPLPGSLTNSGIGNGEGGGRVNNPDNPNR